jgi:hypothetical protein
VLTRLAFALALASSCALAVLAAPARALVPCPAVPCVGGITALTGPRALALAGGTGVASGNEGLFVNPGAVAARRRYSVETLFGVDRRGATDVGKYVGASVVDALSAPVSVALAWMRPLEGAETGNLFIGGLAGALASRLYLGAQVRYYALEDHTDGLHVVSVSEVTADAGLFWEVSDLISLGVSGFNLVPTGAEEVAPRTVGAGLAIGSDTGVKLTADWRADFDSVIDPLTNQPVTTNRYGVGMEALLGNMVPLRAGYQKDETLGTTWWSVGAGLITASGVSIDAGYRQSLDESDARTFSLTFKMQFLEI